jgi:imidazolonepropionase-like amidohydrolase
MRKCLAAIAGILLLAGCQRSDVKVLIGATAIVAPGAQPIEDSVIVVTGRSVRSVGLRKDIPIPQDSERTDLAGKWVIPAAGGRIAVGESANLLILDHAPSDHAPGGAAAASPGDISRRLTDGRWQSNN